MYITIVIPTYWGRKTGNPRRAGDGVYDHPTPIDTDGLLGRCIESLKVITGPEFNILIITSATNPALEEAAEAKVESIISPFRDTFAISQFGNSDLAVLRRRLVHSGFDPKLVGLDNYGRIRNCQLIGPHLLDSDIVVGIDDDEIITDRDYMNKALKYLGRQWNGKRVDGVAGIYVDKDGLNRNIERPGIRNTTNLFKKKAAIENDAHEVMESHHGELVESTIALGGNMVFSRSLLTEVSFDPWITRGEDVDYLINSRLRGYHWFLYKELSIVHLPPGPQIRGHHSPPSYSKLQQDVIRFIYTQAKLVEAEKHKNFTSIKPEELDPYPGQFLRPGIESHALAELTDLRPKDVDTHIFSAPEEIIADAVRYTRESVTKYFTFAETWPGMMAALTRDKVMCDHIKRKMGI